MKEVEIPFRWRSRGGIFHDPKAMATKHVFFTLRMIWNHTAPKPMRIEPYHEYQFSSFYTSEYIQRAIRVLSDELSHRNDLTPYYKKCIRIIICHCQTLEGEKQCLLKPATARRN